MFDSRGHVSVVRIPLFLTVAQPEIVNSDFCLSPRSAYLRDFQQRAFSKIVGIIGVLD